MTTFSMPLAGKLTAGFVAAGLFTNLHGKLSTDIFFASFAGGYVLALVAHGLWTRGGLRVIGGILKLAGVFVVDFIVANFQLARDVLAPRPNFHPAVLGVDTGNLTMGERVLLAIIITLTPGSFALDSTDDGNKLFVHTLYARDVQHTRRQLHHYVDLILATRISNKGRE